MDGVKDTTPEHPENWKIQPKFGREVRQLPFLNATNRIRLIPHEFAGEWWGTSLGFRIVSWYLSRVITSFYRRNNVLVVAEDMFRIPISFATALFLRTSGILLSGR